MTHPWFKRWFGEHYKRLYPHRDLREAEGQVLPLLRRLPVTSTWRILDVGCGSGRHLEVFAARGIPGALGADLSLPLLRDARARGLRVVRADMRHLPYRPGGFDLVTSFFTSFGYFATIEEDVDTLAQFVSVLKPGGYLFLDLINSAHLIQNLVPSDSRTVEGAVVEQKRRLEQAAGASTGVARTVVVKDIAISRPGEPVERFEERVRLYTRADMHRLAARFGLRDIAVYGDEAGGAYHAESSPRMALLLQLDPAARE